MSVIMGVIVGLTFCSGSEGPECGTSAWGVALGGGARGAPAVDLSVLALLLSLRRLALRGASVEELRPARRLLIFCSG
jgi:hypothetical protein